MDSFWSVSLGSIFVGKNISFWQEIRRQLEQLAGGKGEEKLKNDDVGHLAAQCPSDE